MGMNMYQKLQILNISELAYLKCNPSRYISGWMPPIRLKIMARWPPST